MDTLQKIWATIFDFQYISLLEIAENLGLADKRLVTDFSAKSSFHCTSCIILQSSSGYKDLTCNRLSVLLTILSGILRPVSFPGLLLWLFQK